MSKPKGGVWTLSILSIAAVLVSWVALSSRVRGDDRKEDVKPRSGELRCGEKVAATPKDKHKSIKVTNSGKTCDVTVKVVCDGGASPADFTVAPGKNDTKDCAEGKVVQSVTFSCATSTDKADCNYEWLLLN